MNPLSILTRARKNACLCLFAAAFHATLLLSPSVHAATLCQVMPPQKTEVIYQLADYVGRLKIVATQSQSQQNLELFGRKHIVQAILLGPDVRGSAFGHAARKWLAESKPKQQFVELRVEAKVGDVLDVMIPHFEDFEAGKFGDFYDCKNLIFREGKLATLLAPKGSGGSVQLTQAVAPETFRRFGLSVDDLPQYHLLKTNEPNSKPITLKRIVQDGYLFYSAVGLPAGRYRLAPKTYPRGFSRAKFAQVGLVWPDMPDNTLKGFTYTSTANESAQQGFLIADRGFLHVTGGLIADQTLQIKTPRLAGNGSGSSPANPALLMPLIKYQMKYLRSQKGNPAEINELEKKALSYSVRPDDIHTIVSGVYQLSAQSGDMTYSFGQDGILTLREAETLSEISMLAGSSDGIRYYLIGDRQKQGDLVLQGFPAVDKLPLVNLKLNFKSPDGQVVSLDKIDSVVVAGDSERNIYEGVRFQGSALYFKALKDQEYFFKIYPASKSFKQEQDFKWRATAHESLTIILK
jgi:hypothetical protein